MTFAFGGDVQYGRYVRGALARHSSDAPLTGVAALLAGAELAMVNLENPVSERDPNGFVGPRAPQRSTYRLRAPPSVLAPLKAAGVDVVATANNHAADLGADGALDTLAALRAAGLAQAGLGMGGDPLAPTTLVAGDTTVHVFAATTFVNLPDETPPSVALLSLPRIKTTLASRIAALRSERPDDVIVVSLHWGIEHAPSPGDEHRAVAHALVDHGANVVVGHHSHVLQPVEVYRGAAIFYSLGNLVFDMPELEARRSAIAALTLRRDGGRWQVEALALHAVVRTPGSDGPVFARREDAAPLFRRIVPESRRRFATPLVDEGTTAVWRPAATRATTP